MTRTYTPLKCLGIVAVLCLLSTAARAADIAASAPTAGDRGDGYMSVQFGPPGFMPGPSPGGPPMGPPGPPFRPVPPAPPYFAPPPPPGPPPFGPPVGPPGPPYGLE
jgi:hypothetical protein